MNFVECESFLESNSNLNDSIDSSNFSVRGYLPKEFCYSYAWSCSLYEGRVFFFCTGLIFRKNYRFQHIFSTGFTSFSSYFFFLNQSPSMSLCMVFDAISCSINKVVSINPSVNVFVFGDINVRHKD